MFLLFAKIQQPLDMVCQNVIFSHLNAQKNAPYPDGRSRREQGQEGDRARPKRRGGNLGRASEGG